MFQFYGTIPKNYENLYRIVRRRSSLEPKVQDLPTIGYASALYQEEVTKGLASNLGSGFVAVLMDKNDSRKAA